MEEDSIAAGSSECLSSSSEENFPSNPSTVFDCLVCGREAHRANYGVISCSRTISKHKSNLCRRGDGKCEVTRGITSICRKCRITKCFAVGMRPTERRNSNRSESTSNEEMAQNALSSHDYTVYSTEMNKSVLTEVIDPPNDMVIRLGEEYRVFLKRRQQYEKSASPNGVVFAASPCGKKFRVTTRDFSNDIFPYAIAELSRLYESVFPEYKSLPEKDIVLATATGPMYVMECSYLTNKYFPKNKRYFFSSTTSILDYENFGLYFTQVGEKADNEALTRMKRFYNELLSNIMFPIMQTSTLTETEYYACLAILCSSFDFAPWISPNVAEIGLRIKNKVFEELNLYYRNDLKCVDVASRLGHLMSWVHGAQVFHKPVFFSRRNCRHSN